jgi:glutathione S-transferase
MSIVFYQAPNSSASPVQWALAELSVPHQSVTFDLSAGDQRKPEFLAINPNGKVPTLVVDGIAIFEALAIMQWLGDRYGVDKRMWPAANDPARLQALSWSTWAYVSFGPAITRLLHASGTRLGKEFYNAAQIEHAQRECSDLLNILDGRLGTQPYLLGETFSIADLIVAGAVGYGSRMGASFTSQARVAAWFERCTARPSWRALFAG